MAGLGGGSIINFASIYGMVGPSWEVYDGTEMTMPSAYSAIKGGVLAMSRFLATYYGPFGVRCNCVSPGGIRDAQPDSFVKSYEGLTPLRRMGRPEDVVGAHGVPRVGRGELRHRPQPRRRRRVDGAMSCAIPDRVLVVGSGSIAARHVRNLLGARSERGRRGDASGPLVGSRLPGRAHHRRARPSRRLPARSRSSLTIPIATSAAALGLVRRDAHVLIEKPVAPAVDDDLRLLASEARRRGPSSCASPTTCGSCRCSAR